MIWAKENMEHTKTAIENEKVIAKADKVDKDELDEAKYDRK